MIITDVPKVLLPLLKANIAPLLLGFHGLGKTEIIKQWAKDQDFMLKMLNLGTVEPGDIVGLPERDDKRGTMKYYIPDWLVDLADYAEENPNKAAVIYLDEFNRVHKDTLNAVWSLFLEKRIHQFQLPKNVYIIAAMNPDDADHTVTDVSDSALMSRLCTIKIEPDSSVFLKYAENRGFHGEMLNFLREHSDYIFHKSAYDVSTPDKKESGREWDLLEKAIYKYELPKEFHYEVIKGMTNSRCAEAYRTYVSTLVNPITTEQLLNDYQGAMEVYNKEFLSKNKLEAIKITLDNIARHYKNLVPSENDVKVVEKFLLEKDQPKDLIYSFLNTSLSQSPGLLTIYSKSKKLRLFVAEVDKLRPLKLPVEESA